MCIRNERDSMPVSRRENGEPYLPDSPYTRYPGECPAIGDPQRDEGRRTEGEGGVPRPSDPSARDHFSLSGLHRTSFLLGAIALLVLLVSEARGQELEAFTSGSGSPRVLLLWSADGGGSGVRYNLYRRESTEPSWPGTPLNGSPIGPETNCASFRTVIPEGSDLWRMLSWALADSTGGIPPITPLANVCQITTLPFGSEKWDRVQVFAGLRSEVARVMGQGYIDNTVSSGKTYYYRVVRVSAGGSEMPLQAGSSDTIVAGSPAPVPTPSGVMAVPGDSRVQILWDIPASLRRQAFDLRRATAPGGPWRPVSDVEYSVEITSTIDLDTLIPPRHGFTDYERYDSSGNRTTHPVPNPPGADLMIAGPQDGVTYYYQVRHRDPMGVAGSWSASVSATPRDSTRPATPQGVQVTAIEEIDGFEISWNRVELDEKGQKEAVRGYRVYRYSQTADPYSGATAVGGLVPQPSDTAVTVSIDDTSPGLRSACGDSTYYYRVETVDSAGMVSYRSIAPGDALKDTTRPDNVTGTEAKGFDEYIRVLWDLNSDCDISEYRVYRAYCNYGDWVPCPDTTYDREAQEMYKRYVRIFSDRAGGSYNPSHTTHWVPPDKGMLPIDCGGPFVLIGSITHEEAAARKASEGKAYFDDMTVPAGSPICYAYLVKAVDRSQNESGTMPLPDPTKEIVVCQKLRDLTPPGPAIISGLLARDSSVIVEWVGPPVQDIAAYHVYRSSQENGPYTWVGGRTVVPPPGVGVPLTSPYKPPAVVGCDSIPLVSRPWMSAGSIVDRVDHHRIWWYRVVGIDQEGNETPHDSAVAISTFTFRSQREGRPEISSIVPVEGPCAFEISWTPSFDGDSAVGFALFRCMSPAGSYYQVGSVVQGNSYTDNTVARNTPYWYRVAMLKPDGSLTELSAPVQGVHP